LFETDFVTSRDQNKQTFRTLIAEAAKLIGEAFPEQPYLGRSATSLAQSVGSDFLSRQRASEEEISQTLRTIVMNSVSVSHPYTAAHLHCPPLLAALAAEVVISTLNQSMDSFDQAPIATVVEQKMVRWLCDKAGFLSSANGTFTTGGSQSNFMGLLLARDAFIQRAWGWSVQKCGLPPDARNLRILCSDVAHFTVERSAAQLGLGTDSVVRIDTDDRFRMKVSSLRSALNSFSAQGLLPMAIVATAGTTDFGSIDPLPEIASVAREAKCWLHIDAAYGGALLFSPQHQAKLVGLESADSLAIDFHKLLWQPIPCSAFLLRDNANFEFIKFHADYLNPDFHEGEGIPNLVSTSLLTSRRFDALKLWISFQSLGSEKLAAMIDRTLALAAFAAKVIRTSPHLELMCDPHLSTVVFRYLPKIPTDVDSINARLRQALFDQGLAVIGHTRVRNRQFLKFTFLNPTVDDMEVKNLIQIIVQQGQKLDMRPASA